jgi:hypothetical protein
MTPIDTLGYIEGQNLNADQFSASDLLSAETLLAQYLQDYYPGLNVQPNGTLYELIVRPQAVLYLLNRSQNESLRDTMSLKGVVDHPELASTSVVDAIMSNLFMTRSPGQNATGVVKMSVSTTSPITITPATKLKIGSLIYAPTATFTAKPTPTSAGDLQLYPVQGADRQSYFYLPVVAAAPGVAYRIADNTALTTVTPFANFIYASAFGDFVGGADQETNQQLIDRVIPTLSVRNRTSRTSVAQVIKEAYPNIISVACQGMADKLMTRDKNNLMGMSSGGFVDVYVKAAGGPLKASVQLSATKVSEVTGGDATYEIAVPRNSVPASYYPSAVYPATANILSTYSISSVVKTYNTVVDSSDGESGVLSPNRVYNINQAAFSRYQKTTIQFLVGPQDTHPSALDVVVDLYQTPDIREIQLFMNDNDQRLLTADTLIRACIPCYLSFSELKVRAKIGTTDATTLRAAVSDYVNNLAIGETFRMDDLVSKIRAVSGVLNIQLPITVTGTIVLPDASASTYTVSSNSDLSIDDSNLSIGVAAENTAFFVELSQIPIGLVEV